MKRTEKTDKILVKYKQYLKLEKSLSDNTVDAYLTDLDKLLAYLTLENINILDVRLEDLEDFSAGLHDIGIHPRSQARILSGIRSFYRFLIMEDYLEADPTELLESPQTGFKLPEVMTVEEIDQLIESIDRGTKEGQRNRAILETLYSCGLRVSELCNLRLSDLFLSDRYIRVTGKGTKQRLVPISEKAIAELECWFEARQEIEPKQGEEDYVFISQKRRQHLSRITVFHNLRVFAQRAGIAKTISPHTFRHTFATHMLEGGANLRFIQAMLGHANIDTTEIYTHLDMRFLRQQVLEHFPRNRMERDTSPAE